MQARGWDWKMSDMIAAAVRRVDLSLTLASWGYFYFWVLFPHHIDFKSVVKSFSLFCSFLKHVTPSGIL